MESESGNIIHVVLAVYDPKGTYSQHAGVVMTSIFERTKSPVCVHILHNETLTGRNRSLLAETAENFAQKVEFHDVSSYIGQLGSKTIQSVQKTGSVGMLFRLAIPEVLPLDKVLYLDCDVVVNMDIKELWDVSVESCSCVGVADGVPSRFSTVLKRKIMRCNAIYINSGVLLMNPPRMKERLAPKQVSSWFMRHNHLRRFNDQEMINSCFRGDIEILERRFNKLDPRDGDTADSILHFVAKPWEAPEISDAVRLYWKTFLKTPWGRLTSEELVETMLNISRQSPYMHRKTKQCYKKILRRLIKDVFRNEAFELAALIVKEPYVRAKCFLTREKT